MLYAVIMAGGRGTRFWPLSRESMPKQLLSIIGERTMIQSTVDRIKPMAPPERIIIVTGASHAGEVRSQLPEIPDENIIVEPVGRNTAPCVALAAMIVEKREPDAVMAVLPSDHIIARPDELRETISVIVKQLESRKDCLATIGIKPSYPETGYGYMKRGEAISDSVFKVEKFLEKPDIGAAKEYVSSGSYFWNSGMFFWRADAVLSLMRRHMPELIGAMEPIGACVDTDDFDEIVQNIYPLLPSVSIDYGLMEKAGAEGKVIMAATDPGWNDVGSWRSLYDLKAPDADGNRGRGRLIAVDSSGILAHNEKRLVAAIGVRDLIIIETDDAVLVCHKDRAQDVRQVIDKLKERGFGDLL